MNWAKTTSRTGKNVAGIVGGFFDGFLNRKPRDILALDGAILCAKHNDFSYVSFLCPTLSGQK
jgi:hypothetical protein